MKKNLILKKLRTGIIPVALASGLVLTCTGLYIAGAGCEEVAQETGLIVSEEQIEETADEVVQTEQEEEITYTLEKNAEPPILQVESVEQYAESELPEVDDDGLPYKRYDIPLDADLQDYIVAEAESKGIEPTLVLAIIGKESEWNPALVGDNGHSFGLMQIQPRWHEAEMQTVGATNLLEPAQNVSTGIEILRLLYEMKSDDVWVLTAYNGGTARANKLEARGIVSDYALAVKVRQSGIKEI